MTRWTLASRARSRLASSCFPRAHGHLRLSVVGHYDPGPASPRFAYTLISSSLINPIALVLRALHLTSCISAPTSSSHFHMHRAQAIASPRYIQLTPAGLGLCHRSPRAHNAIERAPRGRMCQAAGYTAVAVQLSVTQAPPPHRQPCGGPASPPTFSR
ncbi:hypothetical protein GSI_08242 [Ganoderma sinense ZZ0214-1]|uniref:Uncharacterized protein n=1 Tax=Ganoderma sinense ZZ0214-1 TaxID=1077348 RepID=A0A2G8S754_9APHY|nr:hypothetical protein GSI_08242 [Ganoderma sinense ZZ0214-1]